MWADPDKDESGKGREKKEGKGGDRKEWGKDVDEANRELRKAEEERDRELDKARAEAEREGKPEKYYEKREKIWDKFREKEAKSRRKLDEKHGRAYERDYDGPRESDRRRFEPEWERRSERPRTDVEEWVKYAETPAECRRTLDRERGRYEIKKIMRSREGGREVYRAIIDERGEDRVVIVTEGGRLIEDYRIRDSGRR